MSTRTNGPLGIAVIGAGYWGPNLVRNFGASPDWNLELVCDLDLERARRVAGPHVEVTDSVERVLDDPRIDAGYAPLFALGMITKIVLVTVLAA